MLVQTKFAVPPVRRSLVARPRLTNKLDRALGDSHRLVVVSAPAGFGKTTLLSEWVARLPLNVAWLELEDDDNYPLRFFEYLCGSIHKAIPEIDDHICQSLKDPDEIATWLVNTLAQIGGRIVLVLDDYHCIKVQTIHTAVASILDHLPAGVTVIISTRVDPPLQLSRLRARNQLTEIRQQDLQFTIEETEEFLRQVFRLKITPIALTLFSAQTEGWAAGVQMAAVSLRDRDEQDYLAYLEEMSGSNRYIMDYLIEEVLAGQPEAVQTFLMKTSILDRMCGSLCDALIDQEEGNSQSMLEYLERANLFVVPLDHNRQWYRYHSLFAGLLQGRLRAMNKDFIKELHLRACRWFEDNGFRSEAIEHALVAKEFERAADLIEAESPTVMKQSQTGLMIHWLKALPEEIIGDRPMLALYHAYSLLLDGKPFEKVMAFLHQADEGDYQVAELSNAMRQLILAFQGDQQNVEKTFTPDQEMTLTDDLYSSSIQTLLRGLTNILRGNLEEGFRVLDQAYQLGMKAGNPMVSAMALCQQGDYDLLAGNLNRAEGLYLKAAELAVDSQGAPLPISGLAFVGLGELFRERGDYKIAQEYLLKGMKLTGVWSTIAKLDAYISTARLKLVTGTPRDAANYLMKAQEIARKFDATQMDDIYIETHLARLWIAQGDMEKVEDWLGKYDLAYENVREELTIENLDFSYHSFLREIHLLVFTRYLINTKRFEQAIDLLDRMLNRFQVKNLKAFQVETLLQKSLAYMHLGKRQQAMIDIENLLQLAAPEGFCSIFIEAGREVKELFTRYKEYLQDEYQDYVGGVLACFDVSQAGDESLSREVVKPGKQPKTGGLMDYTGELLSDRELEVLKLLAAGYSNQEIAQALVVAVSTVKTHINHIYRKLGVTKRTQAMARGNDLGLI